MEYTPYTTELATLAGLESEIPEATDGEALRSINFKDFPRISPFWGGSFHHARWTGTMSHRILKNDIGFGGGFETETT